MPAPWTSPLEAGRNFPIHPTGTGFTRKPMRTPTDTGSLI